jgi:hypothetical protein
MSPPAGVYGTRSPHEEPTFRGSWIGTTVTSLDSRGLGNLTNKNAIKGMTVCYTHGGAAPQVREAARLRLACLVAPALQVGHEILQDKGHPQRLAAAKEVLERNRLYASGVEPPQRGAFQPSVTTWRRHPWPHAVCLPAPAETDVDAHLPAHPQPGRPRRRHRG